jgi:hypothetical protein
VTVNTAVDIVWTRLARDEGLNIYEAIGSERGTIPDSDLDPVSGVKIVTVVDGRRNLLRDYSDGLPIDVGRMSDYSAARRAPASAASASP